IEKTQLANGLMVQLKEIHSAPLVSHWLWYRVGARNDPKGCSGISHWVEHMQFKGTPKFPSGALDKAISRDGGVWNAFTYLDWTAYYETLPADRFELALQLEADRMSHSLYDLQGVESERTVVISEREGNENEPLFRLDEAMERQAFKTHPYGLEIIGSMEDLHRITREDLYQHYRGYYVPNNAVVAIAGDFDSAEMLKMIQNVYGEIPPGRTPVPTIPTEPQLSEEERVEIYGPGETAYLRLAYRAPVASDLDFFCLSVLDSLLSGPASLNMFGGGGVSNKTSRLYRSLVEADLAVSIGGSLQATIDPYLYTLTATVHPDSQPLGVLAAIDDEIRRLQDSLVSADEIARAIKQARALFAYGSENITNQAFWLGYAEMFDHYDWFVEYVPKLEQVTPADVQRGAQTILLPQRRVVGVYLPGSEQEGQP
ncbi:MAG: pitrilysin family protein, partial [Anaerolineaceae bacterium]|nr:pitrilysin family protein [Anaerolineaceae bacterium]